eukprot:TRINITY_DN11304_c0_g1_i6.p1 TRINITY_DN11304_c0_g1~~TRINITY_DN11304_c0_g1_i6.p1  ORF type:complete len:102 (+),score=33.58 TRINITY_DN11304_c0_g1_i6:55-360(+)
MSLQAFFQRQAQLPHVLLISKKTVVSPLFKAFSGRFKDQIIFGQMTLAQLSQLPAEAKTLLNNQVKSVPTMLLKTKDGKFHVLDSADRNVLFQQIKKLTGL